MNKKNLLVRLAGAASLLALAAATHASPAPEALRSAAQKAVSTNPEVQGRWHAFQAAGAEQTITAYTTGYTWFDNTPVGSAAIASSPRSSIASPSARCWRPA